MYIPGFDPSSMTDDELLNKKSDLSRRAGYASRFGSFEAAEQLYAMIHAIDAERLERASKVAHEYRQKMSPDVIESDPSMIPTENDGPSEVAAAEQIAQRRRANRDRMIIGRSAEVDKKTILKKSSSPDGLDDPKG